MDYTVLIVEDEPRLRAVLCDWFRGKGDDPDPAENGAEALERLSAAEYDAVLLDILMPELDGYSVCRAARKVSDVPILFLTALSDEEDKLLGYELGADDYVTKPFNPLEVLARVRAQLRRYAQLGGMETRAASLACGGIAMDDESKRVTNLGEEISLTPTEYDILRLLLQNPGKVFSSREIYRRVWKDAPLSAEGTVPVHIRHLREKLEIDPANPRYLKVVWGKGYKLEETKR